MNPFEWKESFNIGHKELDDDHRRFFELLNDCYLRSCSSGTGRIDPELVHKIREYTAMHFSYEEQVMRDCRFPDYEQHEKRHRQFEQRLAELEHINTAVGTQKFESMFSFLLDWFVDHVLEEDKKYGPYVTEHAKPAER